MKKILGIFVFCALLSFSLGYSTSALPQNSHTLLIEDIELPEVIYPGDTFALTFYVRNAWYEPIDDPYVYLEGKYPLLKVSPTKPIKLEPLVYEYDPWFRKFAKVSYNITVEQDATAGVYTLYAVFSFTKCSQALSMQGCAKERFTEKIPIKITIRGKPKLEIFPEASKPDKIYSGDTAEIKFSVANLGSDIARDVVASFSSIENIDVLWYSKKVYLGNIAPKAKNFGTIRIDVDEEAIAKSYELPVKMVYESWDGKEHVRYTKLKIDIEEKADFEVSPAKEILLSDSKENLVTFTIKNKGTKTAEELKLILRASYPFTPTGGEYYVGELKPGQEVNVKFHVDVDKKASSQRYPIDIIFQWKNDKEYSKVVSSYIEVEKKESKAWVYAIPLLIVIAIAIAIKKRKLG